MLKKLAGKYKHGLLLLYFPIYMMIFSYLQRVMPDQIHIIHCSFDQLIPFCEYFVVPYLLWFLYLGIFGIYFLIFDKEAFCKMMFMGMIGMTVFLLVSILYPNGLEIRPVEFARSNIFVDLTKYIYASDPARNVLPSIHVFNSVGIYLCIRRSHSFENQKLVQAGTLVLTVSIVLSTMFLKQHSVFDVITALVMNSISYELVYNYKYVKQLRQVKYMYLLHKKKTRYKYKIH